MFILILFLFCLTEWLLFASIGHKFIEAMYKGESLGFLNKIIDGQAVHPLEHYLKTANKFLSIGSNRQGTCKRAFKRRVYRTSVLFCFNELRALFWVCEVLFQDAESDLG